MDLTTGWHMARCHVVLPLTLEPFRHPLLSSLHKYTCAKLRSVRIRATFRYVGDMWPWLRGDTMLYADV